MKLRKVIAAMSAATVAICSTVSAGAVVISDKATKLDSSWGTWVDMDASNFSAADVLTVYVSDIGDDAKLCVKSKDAGWPQLAIGDVYETDASTSSIVEQGLIVLSKDATVVNVALTKDMASSLNTYGGLVAGANLTIDSIKYGEKAEIKKDAPAEDTKADEVKAEPVTVKIAYTDGKTPSYTYKVGAGVKDLKVKVAMTGNVEWNDWCGAGVVVTDAKGNKTYYQWGGAQVSWGWDADGDKVDDSKDGVKGSTWAGTIGTDGGEISVPVSDGATVEFYCLSWDSQPGVDQYTLTFDAPSAEETKADDAKKDETPVEPTEETTDVSSEETEDVSSEETTDDVSSEETADVSSEDVSSEETAEDNSAWEEAVANASKDIADYLDVDSANKTLFLKYDDGKVGYADAAGIDIASITGVKFNVTFDELEVADESVWIGGGIGANSNSTSWLQNEWGRNDKPIIADLENGTITWDNGAPIFTADDKYAQLWVCSWGGSFAVDSVELLFADNGDASADDTKTDDTKTDDTKGSPDTGVAGVAVAAGVVALAGAAVVVSRKRK